MNRTYIGRRTYGRTIEGGFHVFVENEGVQHPLDPTPSQEIINHSPDGFNWGYSGSGPSQLALGILYDVTGDRNLSLRYYHDFKEDCIRSMPDQWQLKENSVITWIEKKMFDELDGVFQTMAEQSKRTKYQGVEPELVAEKIVEENWNMSSVLFEVLRRQLEYNITKFRLHKEKNNEL